MIIKRAAVLKNQKRREKKMIKKIYLTIIILALLIIGIVPATFAIMACPGFASFEQPNGTVIQVCSKGDEFLGWHEDGEGNLVVYDIHQNGFCYAAWTDDGPVSMGELVGSLADDLIPVPKTRGEDIPQTVIDNAEQIRSEEMAALLESRLMLPDLDLFAPTDTEASAPPYIASIASLQRKVLIVHVTWSDRSGINTPKLNGNQIYNLVFNPSSNSVNKYYKELLGASTDIILAANVNSPLNGCQGVIEVTLPGAHTNPQSNSSYSSALLSSAITAACSQGLINLADFNTNGDGILQTSELSIGFIVDGYEASYQLNIAPAIWGVSMGSFFTPAAESTNGVKIESYFAQGAFHRTSGSTTSDMLTPGIICHELGHSAYKFIDTYDYGSLTGPSSPSQGHGFWSLMSRGSWAHKDKENPGMSPSYPDAYNLVKCGLVAPGTIMDSAAATLKSPLDIYIFSTPDPKQYFLLQLRKYGSVDNFDRGGFFMMQADSDMTHGGLLIYHVDENVPASGACYNYKPGHYHVAIEEAHGGVQNLQQNTGSYMNSGDLNDLWGTGKSEFSNASDPPSGLYSAFSNSLTPLPTQTTPSYVTISNITWNSGSQTVTLNMPLNSHTVIYNYRENGGTSATKTSDTINQGMAIDLTPKAGKENWTFVGWNTNKDATTGLTSLIMGVSDLTLYAIYKRELKGTFIDYSGIFMLTRYQSMTIYNKETSGNVLAPLQSAYTGWTARGWSRLTEPGANITVASDKYCAINMDTTFYGLYQRTLNLSYNANGGSPTPNNQTDIQYANSWAIRNVTKHDFVLAKAPTRTGYNFNKWIESDFYGTKYDAGSKITITDHTTMNATWIAASETVWSLTAGVNSKSGVMSAVRDIHPYKFIAPVSGTYTFFTSNKASSLEYLDGYLYNSPDSNSPLAEVEDQGAGFSFTASLEAGKTYYLKLDAFLGTGAYTINITVPSTGNTVSYNYSENGGTSATKTSATVAQGAKVDLTPTAEKADWTFVGWNSNKDATTGLTSLNMGAANLTLFAIYKRVLTATFIDYKGTAIQNNKTTVTIYNKATEANLTLRTQNAYTGWKAGGWYLRFSLLGQSIYMNLSIINNTYKISSDTTFYGKYTRDLSLSYNANGGSAAPAAQKGTQYVYSYDINLLYNPSILLANAPTRTGYTFNGWAQGSAAGTKYNVGDEIKISANTTMYATWVALIN